MSKRTGAKGSANPNWRGGRTVTPAGYVLLRLPDHPAADVRGYVYEHKVVMERVLGRRLAPGERVRHRNNEPGDNAPGNLVLVSPLDRKAMTTCVCGCGTSMTVLDDAGRKRRFASGHNTERGVREGARPKSETGAGLDPQWRAETLADFGGLCAYGCGRPAAQWDHVIPWSQGGSFEMPGNAVPACRSCNQKKSGTADPWAWLDRGVMNGSHGEQLADVIILAVSVGSLWIPEDEAPGASERVPA